MEEISRNEYFINNLIFSLNQFTTQHLDKNITDFKKFISNIEFSESESNSLYARCVKQLKAIGKYDKEEYLSLAMSICTNYLEVATNNNPLKKHTDNRKDKYKQLNLDIPKETMEKFDYYLKQNNKTKKSVIQKAIEDYISENEKNKKSS